MKTLIVLTLTIFVAAAAFAKEPFTDQDLNDVLQTNETGIIYMWSPYMPLSVIGREDILKIGKKMNLNVTLVVDPLATQTDTPDPLMRSHALMEFGVLDHYPAIVLHKDGQLVEDVIIHGYEKKKTLTRLIKSYLNGNKK